jgi:hypothetical protein
MITFQFIPKDFVKWFRTVVELMVKACETILVER